jgi:hypothetical protein
MFLCVCVCVCVCVNQNIGYRIDMDQFGSKIYKNEKMLIGSGEFGAITPGSSVLYSSYIVCFDSVKGNILFGRNGRVMFAYKDVNPSPALFFGFGTRGSVQPVRWCSPLFARVDRSFVSCLWDHHDEALMCDRVAVCFIALRSFVRCVLCVARCAEPRRP